MRIRLNPRSLVMQNGLSASGLLCTGWLVLAHALFATVTITAPATNTVVSPGQTVQVTVDAGGKAYRFMGLIGENPIGFSQPVHSPPYSFAVTIPADIPALRPYRLTASGNFGPSQNADSKPILLAVERSDQPVKLKAEISYLELAVQEKTAISVDATFADGLVFDVTHSTRTAYVSSDPAIATVAADGIIKAVAPGKCKITVDGMLVIPVVVQPPVRVLPGYAVMYPSKTRQFAAPLGDPAADGVRWSVTPAGSGRIDDRGLFTAASTVTSAHYVTITATSEGAGTASGSASATVLLEPSLSLAISPSTAALHAGQVEFFQAQLTNDVNGEGVTWSITPAGVGAILNSSTFGFVYQAPATTVAAAQQLKLVAVSIADPSKSASVVISLSH